MDRDVLMEVKDEGKILAALEISLERFLVILYAVKFHWRFISRRVTETFLGIGLWWQREKEDLRLGRKFGEWHKV